jgi:predicted GNAT superfamily acetyltransferase
MGNDKIIYSSIEGMPAEVELKNIMRLYTEIFKDADLDFFKDRCKSHPKLFSVLAFDEVSLVGFKMGYPYSETVFYSWIGGVLQRCRHQGIGKGLAKIQEQWAVDQGFTALRTKSMNRYKAMMTLNLKNGFDITQVYTNSRGQTKIVFEKQLM